MENLQATFFRTIYTGLRQQSIRNELRQVLKDATIEDADLLIEVSEAAANEVYLPFSVCGREIIRKKITVV